MRSWASNHLFTLRTGSWTTRPLLPMRCCGRLVDYPPYHSKYNPIERCWSALEQKWGGALLNRLKVILQEALRMTGKGHRPTVKRLAGDYQNGVRLSKTEMRPYETRLKRSQTLQKYDIAIKPNRTAGMLDVLMSDSSRDADFPMRRTPPHLRF